MAVNQTFANLKLGLMTLIGQPDRDPVRELLLNCGIRTILDRVNRELEKLEDETGAAIQQAARQAADKATADILKKVGDLLKEWDKAKQDVKTKGWDTIHDVLYGPLAQDLGLGAAIVKAVAEGEIRAWADGFEGDLQRTGRELTESTARALDELNQISGKLKQTTLTNLGKMLKDSLEVPEILDPQTYAAKVKQALPADMPPAVGKTIDDLLAGKLPTEKQGRDLANALEKHAVKEATQFLKDKLGGQGGKTLELVEGILDLKDRPKWNSQTGFENIKAYAGVAQAALQLLGNSQAAQDVGKAIAMAQTGMQIYQAATVLMAASGWGVALGAVSVLGGMGSLSSFSGLGGGGGNDNTAVLQAIQALKDYLVKQFQVLHERLDRIESNLQLIHQLLKEMKATVEEIRYHVISLQEDTGNMQTQISLGTLATLEEIDEQKTTLWDAIVDAQLAINAREVADFKAFFHSRVLDAFDGPRVLQGLAADPFAELGRFTRALSTQRRSDLPRFVVEDISGKAHAPIALLLGAINHYSSISLEVPKHTVELARLAINPGIALGAIERWLQVDRLEKRVPRLKSEAKGLAGLSREHLKNMRRALECVEGIAGMVRPPNVSLSNPPSNYAGVASTFELLMTHLDNHVNKFGEELDQVEFDAVRSYLLDVAGELSTGGEAQGHRTKWPSTPVSTSTSITLNIPTEQDQSFMDFKQLNLDHEHFVGRLPALLVRNLTGGYAPALEVLATVQGNPVFDTKIANQRGVMTPTYKLTFQLYGVPIERLESNWSPALYYTGYLNYDGTETHDYIWSRMSTPPYIHHARRQLFWSWHQPGNSGADAKYPSEDIPNLTIWGVLRGRITDEFSKTETWLKTTKATSVSDAYSKASQDPSEQATAALLAHAVQPIRRAILKDYLKQHNSEADATLAPLRNRLSELQNILVTVRAALLTGMPDAYLQLDLVHVLFDGHPTRLQLQLPHSKLLEEGHWDWFTQIVEEECKRPPSTDPKVPNVEANATISDSLPYAQAIKKSVYLLKRCIDKMATVSPNTSVPVRVVLLSDALRRAEIAAGLLPGGTIRVPRMDPLDELSDLQEAASLIGDSDGGGGKYDGVDGGCADEGDNGGKDTHGAKLPCRQPACDPLQPATRSNGDANSASLES